MKQKKQRTFDYYMELGAKVRLIKTLLAELYTDSSLLPKTQAHHIASAINQVTKIGYDMENQMYADHFINTRTGYHSVFNGPIDRSEPITQIDSIVRHKAKWICREFLKEEE